MKIPFLFSFLSSFAIFSYGQSSRVADFFIKATNENKILVVWTMEAGSTCPLLSVEKSTDDQNYSLAYTYPSVCGVSDRQVTYSWIDDQPVNYAVNYYRLNLEDVEYTLPDSIDLQSNLNKNKALVSPNPNRGEIKINHRNERNLDYTVFLYSSRGDFIVSETNLKGRQHTFNADLQNGFYIIRIVYSDNSSETVNLTILK